MVKLLAVSGGGVKGIIPAVILTEIERRTGKRIANLFQHIAGTSTGAILALGLTVPSPSNYTEPKFTADELLNFYEMYGDKIFEVSTLSKLRILRPFLNPKFSEKNLEDILNTYFEDSMLSQVVTDVLITSYEIEKRIPFMFKSSKARKNRTYNFRVKDVARATSAAPTFFRPHLIKGMLQNDPSYALIDGGVYTNNPSMDLFVEGLNQYPEEQEFLLVSLGTGQMTKQIPYKKAKYYGLIGWGAEGRILNVMMDGQDKVVDYHLKNTFSDRRYFRFNPELTPGTEALDNASKDNINKLKDIAHNLIKTESQRIDELCNILLNN